MAKLERSVSWKPEKERVLVTGAGGFIGSYVVAKLIKAGYRVRAAELFPERCTNLLALIEAGHPLEMVQANLLEADTWPAAVADCTFVVHMAAVVAMDCKESEAEERMIKPGLQGTLNVLKAAAKAGVKRTVLTSSLGAIASPPEIAKLAEEGTPISSSFWADPVKATPYCRSKSIAERAAWDFIASPEGQGMELVVINPGIVMGPALSPHLNESMRLITRIMDGESPALPDIMLPMVHVTDVADAHVAALTNAKAVGKRFLLVKERTSLLDLANRLRPTFEPLGYKIPKRRLPYFIMKVASYFDLALQRSMVLDGVKPTFDCSPAQEVFGLPQRGLDQGLWEMVTDTVDKGYLPQTPPFIRWRLTQGTMAASTKRMSFSKVMEDAEGGGEELKVEGHDVRGQ